jgi:ribonuclease HI
MKLANLLRLDVYVDGGCLNNGGIQTHCYGSYAVHAVGKDGTVERAFLKTEPYYLINTNNEAEYTALCHATTYIYDLNYRVTHTEGIVLPVCIHMDSALVVNQVNGKFKVKADNLRDLHSRAVHGLLAINATLDKVDRSLIVDAVGH